MSTSHAKLLLLYRATTALCAFMLLWILVLPSSGFQGDNNTLWEKARERMMSRQTYIQQSLVQKFKGQTLVHWTHTYPSALWAGFVPFQLHRGFRKHNYWLHRIMGYIFLLSSAAMMVGVVIIFQRNLLFIKFYDHATAASFSHSETVVALFGVWFVVTATIATIKIRARQFAAHQHWIIRHIGSGLWVAVMRVLIILQKPFFSPPLHHGHVSQMTQARVFVYSALVGMLITVLASEYAIRLLKLEQYHKVK